MAANHEQAVDIRLGTLTLHGDLGLPQGIRGLVIFVHGSGSSRRSVRNRQVAAELQRQGFGTLLFDLLTEEEDRVYEARFDIALLSRRLLDVTTWVSERANLAALPLGFFGASTGAAAALNVAADQGARVSAVVSRGGRPDLAMSKLAQVQSPTLLIVGGNDHEVIQLNQKAYQALRCQRELAIVPGATHLFEEAGALDQVARLAGDWFSGCFVPAVGSNTA